MKILLSCGIVETSEGLLWGQTFDPNRPVVQAKTAEMLPVCLLDSSRATALGEIPTENHNWQETSWLRWVGLRQLSTRVVSIFLNMSGIELLLEGSHPCWYEMSVHSISARRYNTLP